MFMFFNIKLDLNAYGRLCTLTKM